MRFLSNALLIFTFFFLFTITSFGQRSSQKDDYSFLIGQDKAQFILDLSDAVILGTDAKDFEEMEPEWNEGVDEMTKKFIESFNKFSIQGRHPFRLTRNNVSDLKVVLRVYNVTKRGTRVEADFEVLDRSDNTLYSSTVVSESGLFGSTLNLMGEALDDMGIKMGKKFNSISISEKQIKSGLKKCIDNNDSLSVAIFVMDNCATDLKQTGLIRRVDESFVLGLYTSFRSSFLSGISKTAQNYDCHKITFGREYPSGAELSLYLVSYRKGEYLVVDMVLDSSQTERSVGQITIDSYAITKGKDVNGWIKVIMGQIGNELGHINVK